jgi:Uma2 family endonuclease
MNIPLSPPLGIVTAADLIRHLGGIPAERIRMTPTPGTATEEDVITVHDREKCLCELVDGILVEKTAGFYESRLAVVLGTMLDTYVCDQDLGIVLGADGTMKIMPGMVRIPDVSFISWYRLPDRRLPEKPIPDLVPDLAVEVLSKGNTPKEMERKLQEYFDAGVRQVWLIDGEARTIRVFTSPNHSRLYKERGRVRGGKLLPGFALTVAELFSRAGRR